MLERGGVRCGLLGQVGQRLLCMDCHRRLLQVGGWGVRAWVGRWDWCVKQGLCIGCAWGLQVAHGVYCLPMRQLRACQLQVDNNVRA
jgi:hypothetical protein